MGAGSRLCVGVCVHICVRERWALRTLGIARSHSQLLLTNISSKIPSLTASVQEQENGLVNYTL